MLWFFHNDKFVEYGDKCKSVSLVDESRNDSNRKYLTCRTDKNLFLIRNGEVSDIDVSYGSNNYVAFDENHYASFDSKDSKITVYVDGKEKTVALEKLGYTPMYNKGQKKPEGERYYANLNNRVAVGVKKRPSGVFDVLVCFQGTDDLIDVFTNLTDSVYDGQHKGYRGMALNHFANDAKNIIAPVDGKNMSLNLPGDINLLGMLKTEPAFVRPLVPAEIDSVMEGTPAAEIGLQKGDRIVAFNGKAIDSYNEFSDQIGILEDMMTAAKTQADSLKVRTATIVVERSAEFRTDSVEFASAIAKLDTLSVTLTSDLKVGFAVKALAGIYEPYTREYGFFESIPAGIKYGWNVLAGYVGDMKYVFTADGAKSLGGFGAIGSLFPPVWDWYLFWKMTAFLSIILAFMNILPIPALDGGHVLFLLYEMVTRRKPSETFMIRAEYVGFGILILLMVVANLNDILRWLGYM